MKIINAVKSEIQNITIELIRCGLAIEYNFPIINGSEIIWTKYTDISCYLKNNKYTDIYKEIDDKKNYNFKMPDGGIFQLMYRFDSKSIISHRLAYYPTSNYELYQNDPLIYEEDYIYGDILNRSVLPVIIRADYNKDDVDSNVHHPYSHITLGEYKNCRIPVNKPISPLSFVNFIVEHFYSVPSVSLGYDLTMKQQVQFEEHIHISDLNRSRFQF